MPEPVVHNAIASTGDAGVRRAWFARLTDVLLTATGVGVIVSVLVHAAMGVIAAGIVVAPAGFGIGAGSPGAGGAREIAVDTELTELTPGELQALDAPMEHVSLAAAQPRIDVSDSAAFDAGAAGGALGDLLATGGSGLGGAGEGDGAGDASDGFGAGFGGAGGGARFFGAEARGRRIAYIVDVSGSMAGPRIEALQRALTESIREMHSQSSFSIVLFSSQSVPLGGRAVWTSASEQNKRAFARHIQRIEAGGMTVPQPAFDMVFSLRPRPDAVFFMTDGIFAPEAVHYIDHLNRSTGTITPVHCIAFASPEAEGLMRQIAEASGGTFTHVAGPTP